MPKSILAAPCNFLSPRHVHLWENDMFFMFSKAIQGLFAKMEKEKTAPRGEPFLGLDDGQNYSAVIMNGVGQYFLRSALTSSAVSAKS